MQVPFSRREILDRLLRNKQVLVNDNGGESGLGAKLFKTFLLKPRINNAQKAQLTKLEQKLLNSEARRTAAMGKV